MLRSSMVAAMIFWPARGKRLTGSSSSLSPTICWYTSRARPRVPPSCGFGWSCSRARSSWASRSRSSSSLALSSRNCASYAALSSCAGGLNYSSFPGVQGSSLATRARPPATASCVPSVVATSPSTLKHSLVGS